MRKLENNIFIKNIPIKWSDAQIKEMLKPFGKIVSFVVKSNVVGKFVFVSYDDPVNEEYGYECAQKAINSLNGRNVEGKELKLIVKLALSK
jgi:RNA recognition motif-containing protein